ncbi:MAG: acyl-CoA dehydrogenase family protein, partial [Acidimicrobiales bacterium]
MTWQLTDEQLAIQAKARALATEVIGPRAKAVDEAEQYPWDNVAALQEAGFTGMTVPQEFGGPGHSFLDAVLVVEEMAKKCGVTGRIAVEANMGAISAVMAYGTDEQKKIAAELVLSGDKPAICITEPGAGSAASLMTTRADRRGDTYIINGKKHWITGGTVSRMHLIFARVFAEDGTEEGIGGFLAFRDETPGLRFGEREPTMGLRAIPEMEVIFEDMEVKA